MVECGKENGRLVPFRDCDEIQTLHDDMVAAKIASGQVYQIGAFTYMTDEGNGRARSNDKATTS